MHDRLPASPRSALVSSLALAAALALGAVACGSSPDPSVGEITSAVSARGDVTAISTISYAPNSFVIGNAFPAWTDDLHGSQVFGQGPGNPQGAEYRCGYLYGESFDHCGWLGGHTVDGSSDAQSCGGDCPRQADDGAVFDPVYTNGTICPQVDKTPGFCSTFMDWNAKGCEDRNGYGNVDPWKARATPDNGLGQVPHGRYLQWRYVSHDGDWVMVMDPGKDGVSSPNWYFVSKRCVSVVYEAHPSPPAALGSGESATQCCAQCNSRVDAYRAGSGASCSAAAKAFCAANGRGGLGYSFDGNCPEAP